MNLSKMEIDKKIQEIINNDISPIIATHGGRIKLKSFNEGIVTITLEGNCNGCPSAQLTTEQIVKEILIKKIPNDVKDVVLSNEISEEMWEYAKALIKNLK